MRTIVKIPRTLFTQARSDLLRRHEFALERVGFFSTRASRTNSTTLVNCIEYHSVADRHYVQDDSVGARINADAITEAMTRAVNSSTGQIHVHWHGGNGLPNPSSTDSEELPHLATSFKNANKSQSNGWMILGESDAYAWLLLPSSSTPLDEASVVIVDSPLIVNRRDTLNLYQNVLAKVAGRLRRKAAISNRYSRQSFLGKDSDRIISQAIIGIIGLGGGGSHIVQQLAHLGFINFVLCDHDVITETNLNRLVGGTTADVRAKRLKTEIATRNIRKLHKNANIKGNGKKWEELAEDLIGCDIVVGCVDSFSARRDIEAFCRRHLIPYVDVGMDVHKSPSSRFEIDGQVILSMPGKPCMHCMGYLNESALATEAAKYGDAGNKPQVVWSNGALASAAVGIIVDLVTGWSGSLTAPSYLAFQGSSLSLAPDKRIAALQKSNCKHYPFANVGDVVLKPL